jgi:hypothetical protein
MGDGAIVFDDGSATRVVPITTDPRAIIASEARLAAEELRREGELTRAQRLALQSPRSSAPKDTTATVVPITTDPLAIARATLADGHGEFLEARRVQEEWLAHRQPARSPEEVAREPRPTLADRYPEAAARIRARRDIEAEPAR